MRIKVIAVGSTKWERLIHRWGVSFLIGEDVFFDTFGDAGVLLNNIRKFNIDTAKIKHIVLSHDDWDHIAGLWYLIHNRKDIAVYVCPGFKQEIKDRIASFGVKLVEAGGMTQIKDGIYSAGELYVESEGRKIYEQSVVIETGDGLAVICGCAHPGIEKIIDTVIKHFNNKIYMVAGGLHLKDNTKDDVAKSVAFLRQHGVQKIAPTHCTGKSAERLMKAVFGSGYIQVKEGACLLLN